jgi:hypothetical protein
MTRWTTVWSGGSGDGVSALVFGDINVMAKTSTLKDNQNDFI